MIGTAAWLPASSFQFLLSAVAGLGVSQWIYTYIYRKNGVREIPYGYIFSWAGGMGGEETGDSSGAAVVAVVAGARPPG